MWQAVEVEEEDAPPPWAQPWVATPEETTVDLGDTRSRGGYGGEMTTPPESESPAACVIDVESGPSTSYSFEGRAASRYGSPFFSPAAASGPGRAHLHRYGGGGGSGAGTPGSFEPAVSRDARRGDGPCLAPSAPSFVGGGEPHPRGGLDPKLRSPPAHRARDASTPDQHSRPGVSAPGLAPYGPGPDERVPSEPRGRSCDARQEGRGIGLDPLRESPALRMLVYEACLRLCFASCLEVGTSGQQGADPRRQSGSSLPDGRHFAEDNFALLRRSFGVERAVLQPLQRGRERGKQGRRSLAANTTDESKERDVMVQGRRAPSAIRLVVSFDEARIVPGEGGAAQVQTPHSSGHGFLHTIGRRLRHPTSSGRPKSLYCHVRLSSSPRDQEKRAKIGSSSSANREVELEVGAGAADEDVVEISVRTKAGQAVGTAQLAVSACMDSDDGGGPACKQHALAVRGRGGEVAGTLRLTTRAEGSSPAGEGDGCGGDGSGASADLEDGLDASKGYDVLLQVALRANGFRRRNLLITKPWHFLLNAFAREYNVPGSTCILQFLKWVVRAATPTTECMDILCQLLPRVLKEKHQQDLCASEQQLLSRILVQVEDLLSKTFQGIKSLSEREASGLCSGHQLAPRDHFPSPVIQKALFLYSQLHDLLAPASQGKLEDHLRRGAHHRFGRIVRDAQDQCQGERGALGDTAGYLAASKIFDALRQELELDQALHRSGLLPAFVNFPEISNAQYAELLYDHLGDLLVSKPPDDFSDALDQLFRSASLYETQQSKFGLAGPKGKSAFVLFSDHVQTWIQRDCTWLCAKLTAKEVSQEISQAERTLGSLHSDHHGHHGHGNGHLYLIPLFRKQNGVFDKVQAFLGKYSGIVKRWPDWVPVLEQSCCKILRQLLRSLGEASGHAGGALGSAPPASGAHHHADQGFDQSIKQMFGCKNTREHAARLSITDAVLLNAERQMLSFVPKLRSAVSALTSGLPRQKGGLPAGVDFRHVEEETRTSYAQAAQRCVLLLSEAPCHRLKRILKEQAKYKPNESSGEVEDVKTLLKPYLTLIDQVLGDHRKMLTSKVWRDVCRGMWDLAAAELLKFVERIHNDKENASGGGFRVRVMTSEVSQILEEFFQQGLHQVLGSEVNERDLQTPFSAKKLRERICGGNRDLSASDSFSVY